MKYTLILDDTKEESITIIAHKKTEVIEQMNTITELKNIPQGSTAEKMKQKNWIYELEDKATELNQTNQQREKMKFKKVKMLKGTLGQYQAE